MNTPKIAKWSSIEIKCLSYQVRDIASTLQVGLGTVNKDNLFQQQKSRENLQNHIHESTRRISKLWRFQKQHRILEQNYKSQLWPMIATHCHTQVLLYKGDSVSVGVIKDVLCRRCCRRTCYIHCIPF